MNNKKGFTLIELLVVIAVLGILSAVVLVAINPAERLRSARDAGAKSDIGQIATALESYYTDTNGTYPLTVSTLSSLITGGYLKQVPSVPAGTGSDDAAYQYASFDSAGGDCTGTESCDGAVVWYDLEAAAAGTAVDWCYQTATGTASIVASGTCAQGL
ncbi:type II secretion system GspH family protein [Patescibacteria group bacterium]|nr:type II secretion system GspH family protein [Patescibacteria group bacterium]